LAAERENLLAAVNYAIDIEDVDLALRLVRNVPSSTMQPGFEILLPVAAVIELPGAVSHDLYPYILAVSANKAAAGGELDHVESACQEALQAAGASTPSMNDARWNISSPSPDNSG
jgi:hypothetical protein